MSKQWRIVLVVITAFVLGGVALVYFGPDVQQVEVAAPAPDFRAVDLATGDSVSLREKFAGHVTLVNIWATWCIPCRVEMPTMEKAYEQLGPKGFRIAAVSIDEGAAEDVKAFARELSLTFDILHDRRGRVQQLYQTSGVPESFLLDRNGIIVKRVIGEYDWSSAANIALIERFLAEPAR